MSEIPAIQSTAFDRRLPALVRATDPAAMVALLRPVLGSCERLAVTLIKHVPGKRCVLAYHDAAGRRVIGKMYRKDRAQRAAVLQAELARTLRGETRTPAVLGSIDELGMVLLEWVPGEPVPEYPQWSVADAARLGRALAHLHAVPLAAAPQSDLAAHERRTCHPGFAAFMREVPERASQVDEVRAAIRDAVLTTNGALVTTHGDFGPRAAFADSARTWLLDLDALCRSDAAFDLAGVRVGLCLHRGADAAMLGETFLAAYRDAGGSMPANLAAYEAFWWLRRAVILRRKQPPGWEAQMHACVTEARESI